MACVRSPGLCSDLERRRMLVRYGFRLASEFEERAVERHLLECDACYDDVAALWRASELVAESRLDLADGANGRREWDAAGRRVGTLLIWLTSLTALLLAIAVALRS